MSLLTPGLHSSFLLIPTFILGSWVRCHHLPTFHWNQGVRFIHFWTKQLQISNRAWIPSSLIALRHQNWTHPLMSLMSLLLQSLQGFSAWLVLFLICLNPSLLPESGLINYDARLGHFFHLFLWPSRCQLSKLICYFLNHPAAFGFQSSTPPHNITLNPANRKADQSLSEFHTAIGAAAHATLDMKQLISCIRVAMVDTISSLPDSEEGLIPVSGSA